MIICRKPLILAVDVLGALALALLITAEMFVVVLPFTRMRAELPEIHAEVLAAQRRKEDAIQNLGMLEQKLAAVRERLALRAQQSYSDFNRFLEQLSRHCAACGLELQEFQPLSVAPRPDFQSWDVRVRARGRFPDFQRVLAGIESWSAFNCVREISIAALNPDGSDADALCEFNWTVRVNYLTAAPAGKADTP